MSPGWVGAVAWPLGVCPAHRFRKGFHAFPEGGLVETWMVRRCCWAPRSVPCASASKGFPRVLFLRPVALAVAVAVAVPFPVGDAVAARQVGERRREAGRRRRREGEEVALLYSKRVPNQGGLGKKQTKQVQKQAKQAFRALSLIHI